MIGNLYGVGRREKLFHISTSKESKSNYDGEGKGERRSEKKKMEKKASLTGKKAHNILCTKENAT